MRAGTAPPARPIVRSSRLLALLARRMPTNPSTKATGTATPAWSRRRSSPCSVTRIATGIAAVASRPRISDQTAARFRGFVPLLLDVGAANCGGRDRAADHAGHADRRQDVRQGRDQVRRDVRLALEWDREREAEPEEERRDERPAGSPLAEDDCGQGDVAATAGHVLREPSGEA